MKLEELKYQIGDEVFVTLDPKQKKRTVTAFYIDTKAVRYYCYDGEDGEYHYEEHLRPFSEAFYFPEQKQ